MFSEYSKAWGNKLTVGIDSKADKTETGLADKPVMMSQSLNSNAGYNIEIGKGILPSCDPTNSPTPRSL